MNTTILFSSLLRDLTGIEQADRELPESGLEVGDLLAQLYSRWPEMEAWDSKILVAVDLDYVGRDAIVKPGQEIAVMPPVQGG